MKRILRVMTVALVMAAMMVAMAGAASAKGVTTFTAYCTDPNPKAEPWYYQGTIIVNPNSPREFVACPRSLEPGR